MTMPPLPSGYEPHELPADYTGPLWIEGQMHAYGEACAAAEREHLLAELRRMHTEAGGMHNYYLFAVRQLERGPNVADKRLP